MAKEKSRITYNNNNTDSIITSEQKYQIYSGRQVWIHATTIDGSQEPNVQIHRYHIIHEMRVNTPKVTPRSLDIR